MKLAIRIDRPQRGSWHNWGGTCAFLDTQFLHFQCYVLGGTYTAISAHAQESTTHRDMVLHLYCGVNGHMLWSCPIHPGSSRILGDCEKVTLGLLSSPQKENYRNLCGFGKFFDKALITCLSLKTHALDYPVHLISVDNWPISQKQVLRATNPFQLQVGSSKWEKISCQ